jgi:hypothetical protein
MTQIGWFFMLLSIAGLFAIVGLLLYQRYENTRHRPKGT